MGELFPMPRLGDLFADVRDHGRTLRISCHPERGAVVLSLWQDSVCRGSFRLAAADLDRFVTTLVEMAPSLRPLPRPADPSSGTPTDGAATAPVPTAIGASADDPVGEPAEQTGDIAGFATFGRPALRIA